MALDTSTNMLLRPDGQSGAMASFYGGFERGLFGSSLAYSASGGLIQHYPGVQYHRHALAFGIPLVQSPRGLWTVSVDGVLARYGEVTILRGYEQYGIASAAKYYVTPQTLIRWEAGGLKRSYRTYPSENYTDFQQYFRLDRFFSFGLTLRGQIDAGVRNDTAFSGDGTERMIGFRARAAKSLNERWGVWAETYLAKTSPSDAPADTTGLYDRVFLDDPYKYSKQGVTVNVKHLIDRGSVQLRSGLMRRQYDGALARTFWYLPPEGWSERESSLYLTIEYVPRWIGSGAVPALDLYYIAVHASESYLSYRSAGLTFRIDY